MNQEKPIKNVQLKFACEQDWHKMMPCGGGRFCGVCQKIVYDFTNKPQADLDKAIEQHNGNICGRFQQNQAQKPMKSLIKAKQIALLAASLTTIGCQSFEGQYAIQPDKNPQKMSENTEPVAQKKDSTEYLIGGMWGEQAEFIGGQKALFAFLSEHIQYPKSVQQNCVQLTIYVGFTVNINGQLTDINIKRGNIPAFNAEAIRVIQSTSGNWKAGKLNGQFIKTNFTMPIKFSLE